MMATTKPDIADGGRHLADIIPMAAATKTDIADDGCYHLTRHPCDGGGH